MANSYKNIVITPNTGSTTGDPTIVFSGGDTNTNTDITLRVYPTSNGTLSFEGNAGQLFSITNDLSNTIFSVNDVSGIPLLEINVASQQITLGQFYGNVGIGTNASNVNNYKLDVIGGANISLPNLTVGGTNVSAAIAAANANAATLSANVNVLAAAVVANDASQGANIATLAAAFVANSQTLSANVNTLAATFASANANNISLSANVNVLAASFVSNSQSLSANVNVLAAVAAAALANTSGVSFNGNLNFPTGNVGIGTTSPSANLHVQGNANITLPDLVVGGTNVIAAIVASNANDASQGANIAVLAASFVSNSQSLSANVAILAGAYTANTVSTRFTGTANNAVLLNGLSSSYFLANSTGTIAGNLTVSGNVAVLGSVSTTQSVYDDVTSGGGLSVRIINPGGGAFSNNSATATGAIKIRLPSAANNNNTMLRTTIKIYNYSGATSTTLQIGGYNFNGGGWYNTFVTQETQSGPELNVRFGYDATTDCIWIGETSSTWSYPKVYITEVEAGHAGGSAAIWRNDWQISLVTAFDTIETTSIAGKSVDSQNFSSIVLPSVNANISLLVTNVNTLAASFVSNSQSLSANVNTLAANVNTLAGAAYPKTGGTISGDVTVTGNLTVSGATTYVNTQTLLIGDNLVTLNADLPGNVQPTENAGLEINRGARTSNAAFIWNETGNSWQFTSNTLAGVYSIIASQTDANNVGAAANNFAAATYLTQSAFNSANANSVSQSANVNVLAAAFVSNSQTLSANVNTLAAALVLANTSAHADIDALSVVANAKVSSVTGTSGRITSSGGTAPAIDLATAGAGAATYSSGISAVTVDAYGRVTSVTGSAGYLTTTDFNTANANSVSQSANVNVLAAAFVSNSQSLSANVNVLAAAVVANDASQGANIATLAASFVSNSQSLSANVNVLAASMIANTASSRYLGMSNNANLLDGYDYVDFEGYFLNTIDMTALANNTYYPVTISLTTGGQRNGNFVKFKLETRLNSGFVPSWATHPSGFTIQLDWEVNASGYGTSAVVRKILAYTEGWSSVTICGGIEQMTNDSLEVIYLRGGGKYYLYSSKAITPTVRTTSFTSTGQTVSPSISTNNNIWSAATGTVSIGSIISDGTLLTGTASSLTAGAVSGLTLNSSASAINPDNVTQNQIGYNTNVSLYGQSDGGLYSSAYSSAWIHQIYGDFRTGQIATRGKNNGTWQSWRLVVDTTNIYTYAAPVTAYGALNVAYSAANTNAASLSANVNTLAASFVSNSQSLSANVNSLIAYTTANDASQGANIAALAATFTSANANTVSLSTNVNVLAASFVSNSQSLSANVNTLAATFASANANNVSLSANVNTLAAATVTIAESLRANRNLSGGGTITVDASYNVLWSSRYIVISNGYGSNFSTSGYFDITCPTSGTITGVGGAVNKTATAAGIPLAAWEALYYILPIGSPFTSVAANFRVVSYTSTIDVPHDWLLIAVRNGDDGLVYFNNGIRLTASQSISSGATYVTTTDFNSANANSVSQSANVNVLAASFVSNTQTLSANVNVLAAALSGYATTGQLANYLPLAGGTLTGRVIQSASGFGVGTDDTINTRIDSGFWQTSNAQISTGWPESTATWYHLISSTHSNDANYYSMQFAGSFFDSNALYYRATNNSGTATWNKLWHAGNDGSGSGLDADTVDGVHASSFYLASNPSGYLTTTDFNTANANSISQSANVNVLAAAFVSNSQTLSANVNVLAAAFVSNTQTLSANVNVLAGTFAAANANNISLSANVNVLAAAFVSNTQTLSANVNVLAAATAARLPLAGGTMTGLIIGRTSSGANTSVSNDGGALSVRGDATNAATISFHRPSAYAINMGLDTDNIFRIGGWSDGVNTYRVQLGTPGGTHTFTGTVAATTFSGAGTSLTGTAASLTAGNATTAGGFTPSQTNGVANRIVVADGSGYINNNYFNSTDDVSAGTITYIMAKFGDNYYRSATAAKVASFLASQSFASPTFTGTGSVTGGFNVTPGNLGTISTGTTTLAASSGNYQYYTNGGAHTIAAPSSDCAIDVLVTNSATAGAITLSGFTAPTGGGGDTYATTNANRYILSVRRINTISTYVWKALQ